MSRIGRDSPGMEINVPRPGQVHSGQWDIPEWIILEQNSPILLLYFSKIGKLKCFCNKTKFFKLKKFQSRQFVDYMWSTHPNQPSSYMYMYLHWLTFRAGLLCCPERLYRPFPGHFPLDMPPWIFRQTFLQGQFPPDIPLSLIPCSAWISLHYIGYLN